MINEHKAIDVWSLAVVMVETLSGCGQLFSGESADVIAARTTAFVSDVRSNLDRQLADLQPPDVRAALVRLLFEMMQPEWGKRCVIKDVQNADLWKLCHFM